MTEVEKVLYARIQTPMIGCCDRFADNMGCDCMESARELDAGIRRAQKARMRCMICQGPDCQNPGEKH
jgi:hypothetical protein